METTLLDLLDPKFPLIYHGLLPSERHFQMTRSRLSRECAVCERPFTVFFWRLNGIPFRTMICQICAKSANVCQVSLLDLDLGLPVLLRNRLLHCHQPDFKSSTRRWYNNRFVDRQIAEGDAWLDSSLRDRILALDAVVVKRAQQFVANDPYLSFRKAPVCPEWLSNECRHGAACYYAHELPNPGEHSPDCSKFGVRCRYLGTVDPNAQAIVEQMLLIDQAAFDRREEEVVVPKDLKWELPQTEEQPMTRPEPEEIFEFEEPLQYDGIDEFDRADLPRLLKGRLVRRDSR
jgi:pre-mRNA-splicing factor RBM22/SLT11